MSGQSSIICDVVLLASDCKMTVTDSVRIPLVPFLELAGTQGRCTLTSSKIEHSAIDSGVTFEKVEMQFQCVYCPKV